MSINLTIIFYVLIVVAMIAFILVQRAPGSTAGSAFGAGASATVFGAKGSGNFLTKTTMLLAFLFFAISMMMAVQAKREFSAVNSGEVDLGVVGTLNDENSDVPSITPVDPVDSDLPTTTTIETSALNMGEDLADSAENQIQQKAIQIKDDADSAMNAAKTEASEIIGEAKDKAAEVQEELKDPEK